MLHIEPIYLNGNQTFLDMKYSLNRFIKVTQQRIWNKEIMRYRIYKSNIALKQFLSLLPANIRYFRKFNPLRPEFFLLNQI
jgi:hypothetical protein